MVVEILAALKDFIIVLGNFIKELQKTIPYKKRYIIIRLFFKIICYYVILEFALITFILILRIDLQLINQFLVFL